MAQFLDKIIVSKRKEIANNKAHISFSELFQIVKDIPPSRTLSRSIYGKKSIIAEIKRASPSRGLLLASFSVEELGKTYQENGASAVSIVTDKTYFNGNLQLIGKLKKHLEIPILRKDFIIDEYQVLESKQAGADAVLLIASLYSLRKLSKFLNMTADLGMEALVEIHTESELQKAIDAGSVLIGVNNRNLKTLEVDLDTSRKLIPLIPDSKIKVAESGIKDEMDLIYFRNLKINAFLVGEALITAAKPGETLKKFCSVLGENDEN
jgi:indole-3-glycerol phosphate synthase